MSEAAVFDDDEEAIRVGEGLYRRVRPKATKIHVFCGSYLVPVIHKWHRGALKGEGGARQGFKLTIPTIPVSCDGRCQRGVR